MSTKTKIVVWGIATIIILSLLGIYLSRLDIPVLQPAGPIGQKEKNLIMEASALSLVVVLPVFAMLIGFSIKYRAGNKNAKYSPNMDGSRLLETVWWGIPIILITVLAAITWRSSHQLDPFKSIGGNKQPLKIQVVALEWKWLFIYPAQNVASVNYLKIPVGTPIDFQITSDAPMNSFWIPQLGGQIYAMSGMATHLNLQADKPGNYSGVSANISGEGFADMRFTANATSSSDFNKWISQLGMSRTRLSLDTYNKIARPSRQSSTVYYSQAKHDLFDKIINKYEAPVYFPASEASL